MSHVETFVGRSVTKHALVLGGGGVAGIAWMTGVLAGLAEAGMDVTGADLVVGTSAGSTVAAQLGSGLSLDELYARQVDPALQNKEIDPGVDLESYVANLADVLDGVSSSLEIGRRIGALALAADTVPEAERRAVIASRLPSHEWPSFKLKIVAVDAETGEPRVFDNSSGVSLVDAVAASCAVPMIWPPVTIDGRRYVDGGIRSTHNADYAADYDKGVALLPMGVTQLVPSQDLLLPSWGDDMTITPNEASAEAIGTTPLDPSTRAPAAKAGRAQGLEIGTLSDVDLREGLSGSS
ncbi:patatin-like phospholipase family protein [Kibdelosporangium aridum]|uniref:NTE family protein n=1 Tax=Kibdelosporangium aridum TaxID=2030 RepID=A0A1W2F6Y1_KIBAR|nr:patatin-like phospholipase family protein [Kibdelosporangium aridum]SMD17673.1 NTE family protein [Kibdelosporangium aridum]